MPVELGALQNELQRIAVYAHARSDENTRQAAAGAMRLRPIRSRSSLTHSPLAGPELLTCPRRQSGRRWPREEAARMGFLSAGRVALEADTLAAEEERIVAMAGEL